MLDELLDYAGFDAIDLSIPVKKKARRIENLEYNSRHLQAHCRKIVGMRQNINRNMREMFGEERYPVIDEESMTNALIKTHKLEYDPLVKDFLYKWEKI